MSGDGGERPPAPPCGAEPLPAGPIDFALPTSVIHSRLVAHRDEMRRAAAATPWWAWRRRAMLDGAAAAYSYEIEALLTHSASWQPFWRRLGRRD